MLEKKRVAWNKGLTKDTDDRVKKNSENTKRSHWSNNLELKEKVSSQISKNTKGRIAHNKGKPGLAGSLNNNYGNKWSQEQKDAASKRKLELNKDPEFKKRFKEAHWVNNPEVKARLSELSSIRISERIKNGTMTSSHFKYKRGWFTSNKTGETFYYMSSFELERFIFLENCKDIKTFTTKHGILLTYYVNEKKHRYTPDILVELFNGTKRLEEIKGCILEPEIFELKNEAAIEYCKQNNMEFKILYKQDLNNL